MRGTARCLLPALLVAVSGCDSGGGESTVEALPSTPPARVEPFIRVLGTAQDGGFPHAACGCSRCSLARWQSDRARSVASLGVVLPETGEVFLIDATPDIRDQIDRLEDVRQPPDDRVDRSPVDGIFLTHAHVGHYLGLAFFGFEAVHTRQLPVYVTPAMASFLRANAPWDQLVEIGNIAPVELVMNEPVELAQGVRVEAFLVPHRDEYADTVGYRISGPRRSVVYVPDTDPWPAWSVALESVLEGADVALLDGSFYSADELPGRSIDEIRHPLVTDSMDLLGDLVAGGLEVYFTHLNHSNPLLDLDSPEKTALEAAGFAVLDDLAEIGL